VYHAHNFDFDLNTRINYLRKMNTIVCGSVVPSRGLCIGSSCDFVVRATGLALTCDTTAGKEHRTLWFVSFRFRSYRFSARTVFIYRHCVSMTCRVTLFVADVECNCLIFSSEKLKKYIADNFLQFTDAQLVTKFLVVLWDPKFCCCVRNRPTLFCPDPYNSSLRNSILILSFRPRQYL
jgi:hypothetical protein